MVNIVSRRRSRARSGCVWLKIECGNFGFFFACFFQVKKEQCQFQSDSILSAKKAGKREKNYVKQCSESAGEQEGGGRVTKVRSRTHDVIAAHQSIDRLLNFAFVIFLLIIFRQCFLYFSSSHAFLFLLLFSLSAFLCNGTAKNTIEMMPDLDIFRESVVLVGSFGRSKMHEIYCDMQAI